MIYTCTMNLAIDLYMGTEELIPFEVNRMQEADYQPNGKGVNVSFILKELGIDNTALGFCGGFTGEFIKTELEKKGITTDFVAVDGINRINVFTRVKAQNLEYKMVNAGPTVKPEQIEALLAKIATLTSEDTLVVSGSNPVGVEFWVLESIAKLSVEKGFKFVLDHSSAFVPTLFSYNPYLLKPNDEELAHWVGKETLTVPEMVMYGKEFVKKGVGKLLISLGKEGAVLITPETVLQVTAPKGEVVNTACAGDTLLGTYLASIHQGLSEQEALIKAVAAGSSTAFRAGLTDFSDVDVLSQQIMIK